MGKRITNTIPLIFQPSSAVLHTSSPKEGLAIKLLSVSLGVLAISYLALVSMSVSNVIARNEAHESSKTLRTTVAELEREYFTLAESVSEASGSGLGLAPVSETHYVKRGSGVVGAAEEAHTEI